MSDEWTIFWETGRKGPEQKTGPEEEVRTPSEDDSGKTKDECLPSGRPQTPQKYRMGTGGWVGYMRTWTSPESWGVDLVF